MFHLDQKEWVPLGKWLGRVYRYLPQSMLREIMIDELAHTGQRRNFMGRMGLAASRRMVAPMF